MVVIKRFITGALLAALLFNVPGAAIGAPAPAPPPSPAVSPAAPPVVKAVWDYKTELGLTDKQVSDMQAAVRQLETLVEDSQGKLQLMNAKLSQQISGNASLDAIRITLEEIAAVQIQVKLTDVRVSRTMMQILTPDQIKKWREIQQKAAAAPGR